MKTDFAASGQSAAARQANAARISPAGYATWNELGNIYKKSGDYQDAINAYARAIDAMPEQPGKATLWNQIGEIYLQLNEIDRAQQAFENALVLEPKHEAARANFLSTADRLLENQPEQEEEKLVEIEEEPVAEIIAELPAASEPALDDEPLAEVDSETETVPVEQPLAEAMETAEIETPVPVAEDVLAEDAPEFVAEEVAPEDVSESVESPVAEETPQPELSEEAMANIEEQTPAPELVAMEVEMPAEATGEPEATESVAEPALPPISELFEQVEEVSGEEVLLAKSVDDGLAILPSPAPFQELSIDRIVSNPYQIREELDVDNLVESVRLYGILQPLLVTPNGERDIFMVISGERRLEAARQAGLETVPVVVRSTDPRLRIELALTDNLSQPVNALDLARTYQYMLAEYELTVEQLAERACVSIESINQALRLLELSEGARRALARGDINVQQALALLAITDTQAQENVLHWVLENKFSTRETEDFVARALGETAVMEVVQNSVREMEPIVETEEDAPLESVVESPVAEEDVVVETVEGQDESSEEAFIEEEVDLPLAEVLREKLDELAGPAEDVLPEPGLEPAESLLSQLPDDVPVAPQVAAALLEVEVLDKPEAELVVMVAEEAQPAPATQPAADDRVQKELLRFMQTSQENPKNPRAWNMLGNTYVDMGNYEEAIGPYQTAIELAPTVAVYHRNLGSVFSHLKRYQEAIDAFQKAVDLDPDHVYSHCALASNFRKLGMEVEAQAHIKFAAPRVKLETAYNQACFQSICGNADRALEFLKAAIDHEAASRGALENDPDLDFIREDPRFAALLDACTS